MSSKNKRLLIFAAAAAVILVASAAAVYLTGRSWLRLSNEDTGEVYLALPVRDGSRFSITFVHSVNQSPVTDIFEVRGEDIYVVETHFSNFGAGMQTEYPDGVTYSYAEDGTIVATGYNILCRDLAYCVGMVSDHTLGFDGREFSLRGLCGRGSLVRFDIVKGLSYAKYQPIKE